ncbi:MAG: GNAT family N-acetyltransferase, partial [Bacteroidia bacterium]|nr:GNAT family N-acetyltransferase [Bacteroidia bacterium]
MEYHKERFEDFSLLIFKDDTLVAVLAANQTQEAVISHQGLTYGGLILRQDLRLADAITAYQTVLQFLEAEHIELLQIKSVPKIYHQLPSDELDYIVFKTDAEIER